ncbi:hypothetical protein FQN55_002756 [Onygenales sp. PD_40]|nr:hypothetical protein FQN55_002756 [Onygenales sp. PD_40]KAK2783438.1 hypothetical protein FQN53_009201 [Emmonsiellopsis sp. PD_33]KAK2793400.1 hypothetical protein FQN52_001537 [Onygenales sp. PD_12]KAK2801331.1 hypothetical protein FQN51_005431 [Onygenales sp. PD_10]
MAPTPSSPDFSALQKEANPTWYTPRCAVRPYCEADIEPIAKGADNPKISKWMRNTFPQPYTIENSRSYFEMASTQSPLQSFVICRRDDNAVLGTFGFQVKDDINYRTLEIGYWLAEDHWGQGYATEVISTMTKWVFETLGHIIRIEANLFEGNAGSGRVLEKAGYALEGRRRKAIEKDGVVLDVLTYCIFRDGY